MFLVIRSAFWLTLAYMVIKPGVALPDPGAVSAQALALGSHALTAQVELIDCTDLACAGGKAALAAALQTTPTASLPMHVELADDPIPLPRPRPDRVG